MKRLFQIELLKLRKNIAIMVIGIIYALVSIFIVFKSTGIKAFYATVTFRTDSSTDSGGRKELFSVGSSYINR